MQITPISSSTSSSTTNPSSTVDYNGFLKLFIAELQNQDPTSPTDSTQYVSQLASYSQVGQTIQTNSKLDSLLATASLAQAEGAIGKTATSSDGTTTGIVDSVSVNSTGDVTATLADGSTLKLDSTVTISTPASSS
jgi:flagellar basal-body rod modification protein FlgD